MGHFVTDRSTPAGAGLEDPKQPHSLFGAPDEDPPPVTPEEDPPAEEPQTVEELHAALRESRARLDERNLAFDALVESPPARAAPPAPPVRRPAPPDPGPMPDPTTEIEAFRTWMAVDGAHRDHQTEQRVSGLREDHDRKSVLDGMWARFQRDYPEQAKNEVFVTTAFQVVTGGRIPDDAAGQDAVLKDISDQIKAQGSSTPKDPPPPTDRTGGLSGGSQTRRTRKASTEPEPVKSLKDQIGDRQVNSPFF